MRTIVIMEMEKETIKEEGLLTTIWGDPTWESIHCISFGYPENPTDEQKQHYKNYFYFLGKVLPCSVCRGHYCEHTNGKFELTDNELKNRKTLTKYVYDFHKCVTASTGMKYNLSYEDVVDKYSSYIANCEMSLEKKAIAYRNYYDKEAPYVPYEYAKCFSEYAVKMGLTDFEKTLHNTEHFRKHKKSNEQSNSGWTNRNEKCWKIIIHMRTKAVSCLISHDSQNAGLPTIDELKLLSMLCSTMTIKKIEKTLEKLGFEFDEKYSFSAI